MTRIARVVVPGLPHHVTQRGNRRERVFFEDEMRAHARPRPLGSCSQARADGIERQIAQRVDEIGVVHRDRGEPPLEEMAGCGGAGVERR